MFVRMGPAGRVARAAAFIVVLLLLLAPVALGAETGTGTVQVRLFNGTQGGGNVSGLDIVLRGQLNGKDLAPVTGRAGSDGFFAFQGIAAGSGYIYQVTTTYQRVEYGSEPFSFATGETTKSISLEVNETTTTLPDASVPTAYTAIYSGQDTIEVREYIFFANDTDRTYIGSREIAPGKRETMRLWLPPEATGFKPAYGLDEASLERTTDGFIDTLPVFPGGREVMYSYRLKVKDGQSSFAWKALYNIGQYDFLVQGDTVQVTAGKLTKAESLNIRNTIFTHYAARNVAAGEIIEVKLSGLTAAAPAPIPNATTGTGPKPVFWITLGAVLVGAAGIIFVRRSRSGRARPAPVEIAGDHKQELLLDLAHLDDDFEAGEISEEAYKKLRATLKSELASLMQDSVREARQS